MTTDTARPVVIGAGITGLLAARLLAERGQRPLVLEAAPRVGGQIRSQPFEGHTVELGAEAAHAGAPEVLELCRAVDPDALVSAQGGATLLLRADRLRPLPAGMGPAGPARIWPLVTAGVLSPGGILRAALEPFAPATPADEDVAVGEFLARRFGPQLTERLVDPLLGNLHGGDVHRLSLQATSPQLASLAREHRSLVVARRRRGSGAPPRFLGLRGGLERLPRALATDERIEVRCSSPVRSIERVGTRYLVTGASGPLARTDTIVLAAPASAAATMLRSLDATVAARLAEQRQATVATVLVAYERSVLADHPAADATGLVLPSSSGRLLKAATFLSRKWPHLADDDRLLVRLSAGRNGDDRLVELDDATLVRVLNAELGEVLGRQLTPVATHVHRWPDALPQLEVGHVARLRSVRGRLRAHPRLVLAGAAYDGLGIAACYRSAATAVAALTDTDHTTRASA